MLVEQHQTDLLLNNANISDLTHFKRLLAIISQTIMSASRNPFAPNQNVAIRLGAEATAIEANRRRTDNDARTNGQRVNGDTQINGQQTNGGTQANDYDTNGAPQPQSEIPATRTPENTLRIEGRLRGEWTCTHYIMFPT